MREIGQNERGFTLVELMVVIMTLAIVLAIGTHNMVGRVPKYQLKSAANQVYSALQLAKMRAVATNRTCWFSINNAGNYYTTFVDSDSDGAADGPSEYDNVGADFPDNVGGVPCFILPRNVDFGFAAGYPGTGPDGVAPAGDTDGFFVSGAPGSNEVGFLPSGIPVVNPGGAAPPSTSVVVFLKNTVGDEFAVSVSITGYVNVWQLYGSNWK